MSLDTTCQIWLTQLEQFLELLDTEFEVLKQRQPEAIDAVNQQKITLLSSLIDTERQIISQLKVNSDINLFEQLSLAHIDAKLTSQLKTIAAQVQQHNQRNGMLLQTLIRLNQFGLSLLTGKNSQAETYGASGQVSSSSPLSNITLATA